MFKINKNRFINGVFNISRISISLLLLGIILFMGGCSSSVKSTPQDKNITAIKTVLEHQFTGPNEEFIEGLDNIPKLEQYYEKRYKSYFTEDMYNRFIVAHAYDYLLMAHNNGKQIKVDTVSVKSIESTEGTYTYKVVVLYGKEGSNQESAEVSGRAKFSKDGKIASIKYLDDGGLSEELRN
ncbi:hypothetical protein [Bacillus sp. JJ1122]|uniref:hypothetical protein n=1 Tax=Bacillus sp. JJ1122 TaxID=3122951 RepID=UPI003000F4D8